MTQKNKSISYIVSFTFGFALGLRSVGVTPLLISLATYITLEIIIAIIASAKADKKQSV